MLRCGMGRRSGGTGKVCPVCAGYIGRARVRALYPARREAEAVQGHIGRACARGIYRARACVRGISGARVCAVYPARGGKGAGLGYIGRARVRGVPGHGVARSGDICI